MQVDKPNNSLKNIYWKQFYMFKSGSVVCGCFLDIFSALPFSIVGIFICIALFRIWSYSSEYFYLHLHFSVYDFDFELVKLRVQVSTMLIRHPCSSLLRYRSQNLGWTAPGKKLPYRVKGLRVAMNMIQTLEATKMKEYARNKINW